MKQSEFRQLFICLTSALLLCSCTNAIRFSAQNEGTADEASTTDSSDSSGGSAHDRTPVSSVPQKSSCQLFRESLGPIDMTATQDLFLSKDSPAMHVDSIRDLSILDYRMQLEVRSAMTVSSINTLAGTSYIHAGRADQIQNITGGLCLTADEIGTIDGVTGTIDLQAKDIMLLRNVSSTSSLVIDGRLHELSIVSGSMNLTVSSIGRVSAISGSASIHTASIESIDDVSSSVSIYGAHIGQITNNHGSICLFDGATVDFPNGNVHQCVEKP